MQHLQNPQHAAQWLRARVMAQLQSETLEVEEMAGLYRRAEAYAARCEAVLGDAWRIVPSEEAIAALRQALDAENVLTMYD